MNPGDGPGLSDWRNQVGSESFKDSYMGSMIMSTLRENLSTLRISLGSYKLSIAEVVREQVVEANCIRPNQSAVLSIRDSHPIVFYVLSDSPLFRK